MDFPELYEGEGRLHTNTTTDETNKKETQVPPELLDESDSHLYRLESPKYDATHYTSVQNRPDPAPKLCYEARAKVLSDYIGYGLPRNSLASMKVNPDNSVSFAVPTSPRGSSREVRIFPDGQIVDKTECYTDELGCIAANNSKMITEEQARVFLTAIGVEGLEDKPADTSMLQGLRTSLAEASAHDRSVCAEANSIGCQ